MNDWENSTDTQLLPGEEINSWEPGQKGEPYRSDESINDKYVRGETRIVTEQARYPLNTIVSLVKSGNYILNPEYQRRHRWSVEKKSKFIESFIINVPIPPIFLYEVDYSVYEVMDGLQRLTAVSQFYQNQFRLDGLTLWPELNGKNYSELPEKIKRGIDRRYLSSIILLLETSKDDKTKEEYLKQLVFERLNSGGEKINAQESRNALYNGRLNQLCISLARNKYFCELWRIPPPTDNEDEYPSEALLNNERYKEMADVELVLRFFAYRQLNKRDSFQSLKDFLDEYLKHGNNFDENLLVELANLFNKTVLFVYELLGSNAFVLKRKEPTIVLYDPIMYTLSLSRLLSKKNILLQKKEQIQDEIERFYDEKTKIIAEILKADSKTRVM